MKLLSATVLSKFYKKGFKQGSLLYKSVFIFLVIMKIVRYLFTKPAPETFAQYDLEPGEYRVVVKESRK